MKYKSKNFLKVLLLRLSQQQKYMQRLPKYKYRYRHQNEGFIMIIVIVMILILTSLLTTYILLLKVETSTTKASANSNTGFYAAEAGLNIRAKQVQDKFVGYTRPQGISPSSWENCLDNDTSNNGSDDFACNTQTFNNQKLITYVKEGENNPSHISVPTGELYAGLNAQEYRYDVISVAVNSRNLPTAILGMRFKSRLIPTFQFLAFYNKDLEVVPLPVMRLNGKMHANGNIYLNAYDRLTINGQITASGTLYSGRKYESTCSNSVYVYYDPTNTRLLSCSGSSRRTYTNSDLSAWNQRIATAVSRLTVPQPESFDAIRGAAYWDKADLRIVLTLDNTTGNPTGIQVSDQDNNSITTATTKLLNGCSLPITTLPSTTLKDEISGDSNYEATDTGLNVASAGGFQAGDVVTVGRDYDSNVIATVNTTANPNTITLRRQLGHTYQTSPNPTIASKNDSVRKAIVSTSDTFYNYREKNGSSGANAGRFIRMLNIDMQGLLDCVHSQNLMGKTLDENSDGGLVLFLTVKGPNATTDVTRSGNPPNHYGVRIYNGAHLYSRISGAPEIRGLTIVSDQAIYTQGDYNTNDDDSTTIGVTERKRPAAFLADTINVLSNAWDMDDSNSRVYSGNLPSSTVLLSNNSGVPNTTRLASNTTINAAFLAGTDITGGAEGAAGQDQPGGTVTFNGGLNNYPRLHENWTDITFTYRGSYVTLGKARRVNGPWCGVDGYLYRGTAYDCNIYSAPDRNWDYDTDFDNAANLPPLTPRFVYLRQEVFSRNFDR